MPKIFEPVLDISQKDLSKLFRHAVHFQEKNNLAGHFRTILKLDPLAHRVTAAGKEVPLGPTEFRLLKLLMARPDRVHSRTQLLDLVWGDHVYIEERTIDVHIRRLRVALEPYRADRMIETVRGSGYRLNAGSSASEAARPH